MQTPLRLSVRNLTLSDPARALVHKSVEKLELFCDRITTCRVMIDVPQRFPTGEPIVYDVRVDITVPGEEIVIKRQPHRELETAIQQAFDAAGRRLQDYARRRRGDVKRPEGARRGIVTQVFPYEGYGFLETEEGREVYFHRHSVLDGAFEQLDVGSAVRFVEEGGHQGPQASTVALAGASH